MVLLHGHRTNTDDHALNTGLLWDSSPHGECSAAPHMAWGLSPAFDITPTLVGPLPHMEDGPTLSMATGTDGRCGTSLARLADAAHWLGLDRQDALEWLTHTAQHIAQHWEPLLRTAAAPVLEDAARMARLVDDVRPSFGYAEWVGRGRI